MIKVTVDYKDTAKKLDFLARQQLPFAFASALTKTTVAAQKQVQNRTRKAFKLATDFIPKGIRVKPAFKAEIIRYGFTSAEIFTAPIISNWMPLHETGDEKKPRRKALAIPLDGLLDQQVKTARGGIRKSMRPKALLDKSKRAAENPRPRGKGRLPSPVFMLRNRKNGLLNVVQRWANGPGGIRTLYQFQPEAKISPRWMFDQTVQRVAMHAFPAYLERELAQAIATARAR